jgi:hypothetical protein
LKSRICSYQEKYNLQSAFKEQKRVPPSQPPNWLVLELLVLESLKVQENQTPRMFREIQAPVLVVSAGVRIPREDANFSPAQPCRLTHAP